MKRANYLSVVLAPLGAVVLVGCSSGGGDSAGGLGFSSSAVTKASVGAKYEYKITTRDDTNDSRKLTGKLPKWLTLSDAGDGTGILSGVPTPVDTGKQHVELSVADKGGSASQNFDIHVSSDFVANTVEDEFDGTTLNPVWRFLDPLKDSSVIVADGNAQIAVKGGLSHDLWVGDQDTAPRILQKVDNKDFGIEVRFSSTPSKRFQMNGVIAQEKDDRFVRFELHHDGTGLRIYAASVDGTVARIRVNQAVQGDPPNELRIMRNGEFWTLQYSADGKTWTDAAAFSQPMMVSEIGLFGGNAIGNTSPEFTAKADFFHNTDLASLPNLSLPEAPGGSGGPGSGGGTSSGGTSSAGGTHSGAGGGTSGGGTTGGGTSTGGTNLGGATP